MSLSFLLKHYVDKNKQVAISESPTMVDHYPEPEPDSPDKPVEYDTESDPDKCKVRVPMLF